MNQRQEKLIESYIRNQVRKSLNEANIMKPNEFTGATIRSIFFSNQKKGWVVDTDKGHFMIDKAQSFIGSQS